ncbi:alpha-ketoglutarate-dependent dioxygenase AlkB family protein [Flagellimonas sp.]|uniref:alpha-ketoglutarate-dependent dioxygenase AlkB family protein n=1 Tax=Flagellimonas sp. TaxID=2058762 RepID=UPI003B50090F
MGLFSEKIILDLADGDITYFPSFFSEELSNNYFQFLKDSIPWQQDKIKVFGKVYDQPRLTALFGDNQNSYSYSGITMQPHVFNPELIQIKERVEKASNTNFTSCLLNYYRDGKDSNGWHSDDEKELGINPIIASISFGASRFFHLRNKVDKTKKHKILLENGSLLLMKGATQHHWQHQIPKTSKPIGGRINLTFRILK